MHPRAGTCFCQILLTQSSLHNLIQEMFTFFSLYKVQWLWGLFTAWRNNNARCWLHHSLRHILNHWVNHYLHVCGKIIYVCESVVPSAGKIGTEKTVLCARQHTENQHVQKKCNYHLSIIRPNADLYWIDRTIKTWCQSLN